MDNKPYTPEAMEQIEEIYDKLGQLPADMRSIAKLMVETFISGMFAQKQLMETQDNE